MLDERIEAILHCAARSLVGESLGEPARYFRDNVAGGIALLEAAREAGVERFVLSSTAAVYGDPDAIPIPEDAPLRPINPYGETKRSFEGALDWYAQAYGLRSVSLRYFNVAGATDAIGEDHEPETHLIPAILAGGDAGRRLTVFGDDYPTRTGPACATTSTWPTSRTPTSARSRRPRGRPSAQRRAARLQPRQR